MTEVKKQNTSKQRSHTIKQSPIEEFKEYLKEKTVNEEEAMDKISYGLQIRIVGDDAKLRTNMFFLSHNNNLSLLYVEKDSRNVHKLEISKITLIKFGNQNGNFKKLTPQSLSEFQSDLCLSIFINTRTLDLVFSKLEDLKEFCFGTYSLWEEFLSSGAKEGYKLSNIKKIWDQYDEDHSGKMDIKEFVEFVKEIRLNVASRGIIELFQKIDTDNSGKIDYNEFVNYFEELTSSKEFESDFNKYAGNKGYMDINNLIQFMKEIQKEEDFQIYNAINMIIYYNKEIDPKLLKEMQEKLERLKDSIKPDLSDWTEREISYFKFKLGMFQSYMLHPIDNSINCIIENSMDFPTNDYFIYSSHNTYLMGHQLYGESSVEMYSYAINMGCRCVELDCWDGKNKEPKITHGMTFTSDILFKDVLTVIKENAFKKTDSPFFLSIEMHCSEEQQKVMANYFKTILVDFWTPEMDGIPDQFPSPNQLKNKFIVKCKKPKVTKKSFVETKPDRQKNYLDVSNRPAVTKHHLDIKRNLSVIKETEENDYSKKGTLLENDKNQNNHNKSFISIKKPEESKMLKEEVKDISVIHDEKTKEEQEKIAKEEIKKKKKTIKEVVPDLYDIIGLTSVHFKVDDLAGANYQPWEVVSLSEGKIIKFLKSEKSKLIEFTSNSFLRVYPIGTRFDSSNFDPTKSWVIGAQLVSLNLQSLNDDYTLLNHLFFKINNESGYILKPEHLRQNTYKTSKPKDYSSPAFTLEFDVLSGIMLQKLLKPESNQLYVTVSVMGSLEDDKNGVLKTDSVKNNCLHPIFSNRSINFSIYEDTLSFLCIKIMDEHSNVLARSVVPLMTLLEGYRNIVLYDEQCHEIENSILILKSKKVY